MLTFFTTAKPFRGHSAIIQRNALKSWTLLDPDVEVILFGDDEGSAEVARELGIRHQPHVEKTELGRNRLDYIFAQAQAIARHDVLCYVNCDIILMVDFRRAFEQVKAAHLQFLMVGRRWDTDITQPLDFSAPDWAAEMRHRALATGRQADDWWIDYFVFTRGLYGPQLPPFAVGRPAWDNWLLWKTLHAKQPVVDASPVVIAVHQNHGYGQHPQGRQGVWQSEEARRNLQLAGGLNHLRTIADATEVLRPDGLRANTKRHWAAAKRGMMRLMRFLYFDLWHPVWFFLLGITRPLRSALGLRSEAVRRSRGKV